MIAHFNISCLSVDGAKIHVEQVGRAVDIESSCRNFIFTIVNRLVGGIARAGYNKQHIAFAHLVFNGANKLGKSLVQFYVGYLHVGLPIGDVFHLGRQRD